MTLRDIERAVYRRLGKNANVPNSETQIRVREFINSRHRRLLRDFPQLRDDVLSFVTVADQDRYALSEQGIARINRIWDTTNRSRLEQRSLNWLRIVDPAPQSGLSTTWIPLSYTQVHTQPADASELFVSSDSASDVNRAYIEGIVDDGSRRRVEVTMTGTTGVSIDSTITDWIEVDKFYLSEAAVGNVTLMEDSGSGDELSAIAPGDTYAKYLSFILYPTPSAVVEYSIDVTRSVLDMVNPYDEPLLPIDFHELLAIGARLDEYEATDDARRRVAEVEWDEGYKALTSFLVAHPDRRMNLNGIQDRGRSTLGGWFPADSVG